MTPTDLREWAKEEVLDAIDDMIRSKHEGADSPDADERDALMLQRNRVARLLRLDEGVSYWDVVKPGERHVTVSLAGLENE